MKSKKFLMIIFLTLTTILFAQEKIVHDAEYYILEAQNGEKWKADDKIVDKKLADFRKKNRPIFNKEGRI